MWWGMGLSQQKHAPGFLVPGFSCQIVHAMYIQYVKFHGLRALERERERDLLEIIFFGV